MDMSDIGAVGVGDETGLYGAVALGVQSTSTDGKASGYARADLTVSENSQWAVFKLGGSYRF